MRRYGRLEELWAGAAPELLVRAAGGQNEAHAIGEWLGPRTFVDFAELEPNEQARLARTLRVFAEALLGVVDPTGPEVDRLWTKRFWRLGTLAAAVGVIVWSVPRAIDAWRWQIDLAAGSSWTASSRYPEHGCVSPQQECAGKGPYFFSTHEEENPWIEFDLRRVMTISRIELQNREECCRERATPVIVEVSTDRERWKEVARRPGEFDTWRTNFGPVPARWVKLRVPKKTNFHLRRVRIGP